MPAETVPAQTDVQGLAERLKRMAELFDSTCMAEAATILETLSAALARVEGERDEWTLERSVGQQQLNALEASVVFAADPHHMRTEVRNNALDCLAALGALTEDQS